jgi:radical SAM superfamily enzyme YgiQ (UPF0313 family)
LKKVLLLNPPSTLHCARVLHRSNLEKPGYRWPQVDFVCLSGHLWESGFVVEYKDFQLHSRLSIWKYLNYHRFGVIVSSYSAFFEQDDLQLLKAINEKYPQTTLILLANHKDRLEPDHSERILRANRFISAIIYDYAHNNVALFLEGVRSEQLFNVFYLGDDKFKGRIEPIPHYFDIPVPRHEIFQSDAYFHYDSMGGLLTATMSSFGCKQRCPFCWGPDLYPGVSVRSPENLAAEMEHIVSSGIQEVYFNDLTFAYDREALLTFCRLMTERNIRLRWFCSSRFDLMNAEMIEAMAVAGCRCIEFGLESGNYHIRKLYGKDFPDSTVKEITRLCKKNGIRTSVFVILGLLEETLADMKKSLNFVFDQNFNYLSLNVMWVEPATTLDRNIDSPKKDIPRTEYARQINFNHPHVSSEQILKLYRKSFRRFYMHPKFILGQIAGIRSFKKIKNLLTILSDILRKDRF